MYKRFLVATAAGSVLCAGISSAAFAQAAASAPKGEAALEEVVVTARRREERLQDVPISVSVVSGSQLEARGVTRVTDLQDTIAGIKVEPQNNKPSTVQVAIRGQRMYGVLSAQDSPTAFYFADSAVLPIQGLNSSMHDLGSIQVLKGPQGTLFGRNTTGGAVLVTPAAPTHEFDAAVTALAGDYETWGLRGFVNIPVNDKLAVRVAADYHRHGGYDTYSPLSRQTAGQKAFDDHVGDVRLSVLWNPTDNIENTAVGYYGKEKSSGIPITIVALNPNSSAAALINGTGAYAGLPTIGSEVWNGQGNPRKNIYSDFPQYDHTSDYGVVDTATLKLDGGVTLKNILSYRHVKNTALLNINGSVSPYVSAFQQGRFSTITEEFQASGNWWDNRITAVAGVFYMRERAMDEQSAAAFYAPPLATKITPFLSLSINKSYAAYAQATAKLTDKLALTVGGRITKDKRYIDWMQRALDRWGVVGIPFVPRCNIQDASGAVLPLSACSITASTSYSKPTYNLSLDYHLTRDIMVYGTQRTGYRSGGYFQRAVSAAQRIPFRPEHVLDREIGFKSEFPVPVADARARFNIDYYHDKYKDIQKNLSQLIDGFPVSSTFNAAAGTVSGVESEAQLDIDRLTVGGTFAYTKTRYSAFSAILGGVNRDFSDRQYAGVPKVQYSLFATFRLPVDERVGHVSVSANLGHQGGSFFSETFQSKAQLAVLYTPAQLARIPDGDRAFKTRPYTLVDLRAEWADIYGRPVDLSVFVRNLTNAKPEVFVNSNYDTAGTAGVGIGAPRTVGAELTYRFR